MPRTNIPRGHCGGKAPCCIFVTASAANTMSRWPSASRVYYTGRRDTLMVCPSILMGIVSLYLHPFSNLTSPTKLIWQRKGAGVLATSKHSRENKHLPRIDLSEASHPFSPLWSRAPGGPSAVEGCRTREVCSSFLSSFHLFLHQPRILALPTEVAETSLSESPC